MTSRSAAGQEKTVPSLMTMLNMVRLPLLRTLRIITFVIIDPSFTGRAVNSIDLSKTNKSKKKEINKEFFHVKLVSSKEKAVITVDGETVCLSVLIL